jgi:hypothetical protein
MRTITDPVSPILVTVGIFASFAACDQGVAEPTTHVREHRALTGSEATQQWEVLVEGDLGDSTSAASALVLSVPVVPLGRASVATWHRRSGPPA